MKPRLIGSLLILTVILALVLPGAYGATINIKHNGGTITGTITTELGGTAKVTGQTGAGPVEFKGSQAKLVSLTGRWDAKRTNTFSEVGLTLRNAETYDAFIQGHQGDTKQTTDASLDLSTLNADYINAYAKSGTAKKYEAGAEMTTVMGSADVKFHTSANGGTQYADATMTTDPNRADAITGDHIDTHAWFKTGTTADVRAHVDDGSIFSYQMDAKAGKGIAAEVSQGTNGYASDINGQHVKLTTTAKATAGGSKEIKATTEIQNGGVIGYTSGVTYDPTAIVSYTAGQGFTFATTGSAATGSISIDNKYTQSLNKIQVESKTSMNNAGSMGGYTSTINADPSITQNVNYANAGDPNNPGGVFLDESYTRSGLLGLGTQTFTSHTDVQNGAIFGYNGIAGTGIDTLKPFEVGTEHAFFSAAGSQINLDDKFTTSLPILSKYYKEVKVQGTDASVLNGLGGDLVSSMTNVFGTSSFDPTALVPTDVRVFGHTSPDTLKDQAGMTVSVDTYWKYNNHLTDGYAWNDDDFYNFFVGNADPVAAVGHFVTDNTGATDSIQSAIDSMPVNNGNIFLDATTYTGTGNYNIVNDANINGEVGFTLWGAGSYMRGASNSVIDAGQNGRIFYLTTHSNSQTFDFKNIDFNNGKTADNGGAMYIDDPPNVRSATVYIEDSTFNNNEAAYGGAIENDYETLHIKNCAFNNNHAATAGGAIRNAQGVVTIDDSQFIGNYANVGGAIAQSDKDDLGSNGGSTTLNGCWFTNNHADHGYGGAIFNGYYGHATTAPKINANGCNFIDNHAYGAGVGNGGAYAATYTQTGAFTAGTTNIITNSVFNGNSAEELGNAIYTKGTASNSFNIGNNLLPQDIVIVP